MKGCLKSPMPSPGLECPRKHVDFGAEVSEEVHFADVWDRTPTEPARKLSYQDLLELKEIQRSLPRANQLADPLSGRPASHYLGNVPIRLVPLLPESSPSSQESSSASSPAVSPPATPTGLSTPAWSFPACRPKYNPPPSASWVPPHLAHLAPKQPIPQAPKPKFAFLPLLDTPPPSEASSPYTSLPSSRSPSPNRDSDLPSDSDTSHDPPTPSLTNASLDSSPPLSRSSSVSPEPSFLQLPPHGAEEYDDMGYSFREHSRFTLDSMRKIARARSSSPPRQSTTTAWQAFPDKKRNSSVSPQRTAPAAPPRAPAPKRNVMIINGIEIDLDDDEDDASPTPAPSSPPRPVSTPTPTTPPIAGHQSPPRNACGSPPVPTTPTRQSPGISNTPSPASVPLLSCSPPGRCTKTLCSPVRFQRDSKSAALAQQGYLRPVGYASP
ncbi:hypothetical protein H0H81_001182 [Sphagnurus paluster]|uniref:Uncharacterized protein n=1 Tax=Sphagnurus paluster TaxID=117069 RepID=A0A9P7KN87_9AGAR|nr:hypothetical protein H0H81_001182 [Sphagnurus paluster]